MKTVLFMLSLTNSMGDTMEHTMNLPVNMCVKEVHKTLDMIVQIEQLSEQIGLSKPILKLNKVGCYEL